METRARKKSDSDVQDKAGGGGGGGGGPHGHAKQYTMNIQRIFHNESNFKFRQLENYDEAEDRELISPADSEPEDLLGLGTLQFINETRNHQYPLMQSRIEDEASRRLISNININKSEELIIIDNDIEEITNTMVVASQPGVIAVQPVKSCTRTNHISSSPYKGISSSKSMSPDGKEFCPNSWFEVDKEMHQDGFCKQLSWKCCFVCVCLPVCYPCYLSRTIRKRWKKGDKSKANDGGLVSAGQLEVYSTLASKKHSTLHSKQSTIHSNVKDISTQTKSNNKEDNTNQESEDVNMNVIILQSNSSNKFIKELIEKNILKNSKIKSQEQQNPKRNMIKNLFLQQKAQQSLDDDSPVLLRKFLSDHPVGIKSKTQHKSNLNSRNRKTSEVFYSLESNLDKSCPSKPPLPTSIVDAQANHLSSLPSMTSGRFYSANSSVFSGVSSPRSDLSPSKESEGRIEEDVCDKPNKHYIEPIVEIVDQFDGIDDEIEIRSRDKSPMNSNSKSFDEVTKPSVMHLDFNSNSSFLKKSFSMTSPYESITKVCDSNEELPLDPGSSSNTSTRKNSVKFNCVNGDKADFTLGQRKYQTLPPKISRQRLSSSSTKHQKLSLKQLGSRSQELPNCPKIIQTLYEEGELSGWSTRDIYDVVSKDLPRMDIVILVVSQEEKKLIDETLSRSTGVVGYIKEYWSGFFPLLLIEVTDKTGEIEMITNKSIIAIHSMFSVTHRIIINNVDKSSDFVFESIARFYNHIKVFQCEKFQQSLHTHKLGHLVSLSLTERFWFCSGLCQMRVTKKKDDTDGAGAARPGFMKSVRNTIIMRSKVQSEDMEVASNEEIA